MCRKNMVPASFLAGVGIGLLLSCLLGFFFSVLLGILLIFMSLILVRC